MKQLILIFAFLLASNFAKSQDIFSSIKLAVKKNFNVKNVNISNVTESDMKEYFALETEYFDITNYGDQIEEIKNEYKIYSIFYNFKYCTWYFDEKIKNKQVQYKMTIVFYNLK